MFYSFFFKRERKGGGERNTDLLTHNVGVSRQRANQLSCWARANYLCSYLRPTPYLWSQFHSLLPPQGNYTGNFPPLCWITPSVQTDRQTDTEISLPILGGKKIKFSIPSSNHSIDLHPHPLYGKLLKAFLHCCLQPRSYSCICKPTPIRLSPSPSLHHSATLQKVPCCLGSPEMTPMLLRPM